MRSIRLLPILLFCALPGSYRAAAQTTPADSARVSYGEEVLAQPLRVDTVALRVQREDRDLWKLGLNNIGLNHGRYGVHIAYERKLGRPAWAVLGEVSPSFLREYLYGFYPNQQFDWTFNVRAQLAGRFYYNLEQRIRQGRNAGNFSANYFSLALGAGFGRYSDTPFNSLILDGPRIHPQVALLYGVQRRLGRYGFFDVNAGFVSFLANKPDVDYPSRANLQIGGSLRIGLVLGGAPVARSYVPNVTSGMLLPQWYVGAQVGVYGYYLHYRGNSYSRYSEGAVAGPYLYVGHYLRPRLAVQLGVQYEHQRTSSSYYTPQQYESTSNQYNLALPLLLRYSLTKLPQRRAQVAIVAGAAVVASQAYYQNRTYPNGQIHPIVTDSGRDWGAAINPMLGLNAAYGFGRTRRVQATVEGVLIRPLVNARYGTDLRPGLSLGLRYRFHYQ